MPPPKGSLFPDLPASTVDRSALIDAGAIDLMRRAGAKARTDIGPLESAPPEQRRVLAGAEAPLREAMEHGLTPLALEWSALAAKRGWMAPTGLLPKLLAIAERHGPEIEPILGERGIWLARSMGIDLDNRPPAAPTRQDLATDWDGLDWRDRLQRISDLEPDLSAADEEILTKAVSDRRKEVREASARLLARIPNAAWVHELEALTSTRVEVVRKLLSKVLLVSPPSPEELPKSLPRASAQSKLGPKALALFDLLKFLSPSFWDRQFGLSPADLIGLARKHEYSDSIIPAWAHAAEIFHDRRWIDALFAELASGGAGFDSQIIPSLVGNQLFEDTVLKHPAKTLQWLELRSSDFSPKFSRTIVEWARDGRTTITQSVFHRLDSSVLPLLDTPWIQQDNARINGRRIVDIRKRLLDTLK